MRKVIFTVAALSLLSASAPVFAAPTTPNYNTCPAGPANASCVIAKTLAYVFASVYKPPVHRP